MTNKEIENIKNTVEKLLGEQRLRDAFRVLERISYQNMLFELTDKVKQLEQTYAYMLNYLTKGADDPQRDSLLNDLVAQCYDILDNLLVKIREKDYPTLYFNIRRYNSKQLPAASVSQSLEKWKQVSNEMKSMDSLLADFNQGENKLRAMLESSEISLFNSIWTSFPLQRNDRKEIVNIVCQEGAPLISSIRFVSALGLASAEYGDSEAMTALCDIYSFNAPSENYLSRQLAASALVWLIIALYKNKNRVFNKTFKVRLDSLKDIPSWEGDVRIAYMELVRSQDTERINRTMREEIIPGMIALRPEIEKKLRGIDDPSELADFNGFNPEWEELLTNSGIGDRLKELNELQMEGSDVFMSTFSHLKNFPFFNEPANWFTPFSDENPSVEKILSDKPDFANIVGIIKDLPFLCDSDKYSMLLSAGMIPKEQISMMLSQFSGQREQMEDFKSHFEGLTHSDSRKADVRNYIHNLYRFVNLFRRKNEFYNIFNKEMDLLKVPVLKDALENAELLRLIGEFYFKRKYYKESLSALTALDEVGEGDAMLYQKMGFAYEKTGDKETAVRFYEQADLLDGDSKWLKMRLAFVYRNTNRIHESINILTKLAERFPEDVEIALQLGYAYINIDNYREAIKQFYKAEFLISDDVRVLRSLAWCLFMVKDFDKSVIYYNKLLLHNPTPEDYLNMGHASLALSDFKEAINYYKMYVVSNNNDKEKFFTALEADKKHLKRVGIKNNIISLIADAMLYELEK